MSDDEREPEEEEFYEETQTWSQLRHLYTLPIVTARSALVFGAFGGGLFGFFVLGLSSWRLGIVIAFTAIIAGLGTWRLVTSMTRRRREEVSQELAVEHLRRGVKKVHKKK